MNSTIEHKKDQINNYFKGLIFDPEPHTYEYKNKQLNSVSSVIYKFVDKVDFDTVAFFVAKKRGITKKEVLKEWEDKKNNSCIKGTRVHNYGEDYGNLILENKDVSSMKASCNLEKAVENFWKSLPKHIIPFQFELQMFSDEYGIAGTTDIILYNTDNQKFILADYKTNEDLFKNFKGKKLLSPFDDLLDNSFNKYQIQLSLYQMLFEQTGYKVYKRKLVWLKPDGTFEMFDTKNYIKRIKKILKNNGK